MAESIPHISHDERYQAASAGIWLHRPDTSQGRRGVPELVFLLVAGVGFEPTQAEPTVLQTAAICALAWGNVINYQTSPRIRHAISVVVSWANAIPSRLQPGRPWAALARRLRLPDTARRASRHDRRVRRLQQPRRTGHRDARIGARRPPRQEAAARTVSWPSWDQRHLSTSPGLGSTGHATGLNLQVIVVR